MTDITDPADAEQGPKGPSDSSRPFRNRRKEEFFKKFEEMVFYDMLCGNEWWLEGDEDGES